MGNGSKAQMKRDRNAKKGPGEAKSQLKANEAAKNVQCTVCKQTFLSTASVKSLAEHSENRHSKKVEECFPGKSA
ncbi:DUF1909-domain-containing protein [Catenaria anguillulae PL171]|uniref:DUF1909-domain-containing protein n=1 Tax=Catenaria anguillulae PL171 TaxID=765915 RepID=A0A1Y2HDS5_9FUNG|nr:DUF1909-domain-containing protein [Catenaria anguillulae PL171]